VAGDEGYLGLFSLMLRLEASLKDGQGVLDLVLQFGPCRVEPVGCRLLRVHGGANQPAVLEAIRRVGGRARWDAGVLVDRGRTAVRVGSVVSDPLHQRLAHTASKPKAIAVT
jgi:hypothetical protein